MSKKRVFTFEECLEIAKKYNRKVDFKNGDRSCFNYSRNMGWYDEITSHIKTAPHKTRTYEEVCDSAKKYNSRMEFKNNDVANYCYAVTHGWLDNVCAHMKPKGDMFKRCIYVYELPNKTCYIGLTYDIDKRDKQHRDPTTLSSVRKYCEDAGITIPKPIVLTEFLSSCEASKKEGEILCEYKKNGWKCLNKAKTGSLGGRKHNFSKGEITKEFCIEIAKKYRNISSFHSKHQNLYRIIKDNGWLEEIKNSAFDLEELKRIKSEQISKRMKGKRPAIIHDNSKPVFQYTLDGKFIKRFNSQKQAAMALGHPKSISDIGRCCSGKLKTCLGFMWKYNSV
jgi:predicted GIY-YIG superfamily endonuclease